MGKHLQKENLPGALLDTSTQGESAIMRDQIIEAALTVLNERGFDGLTMRNIAQKLGIKAASLYWHVRNKQELLTLVADAICAPMQEPDRALSWQNQLETLAHEFRRVLLGYRDAARVLVSSGAPIGPHRLHFAEISLRILLDAGFPRKDAAYAGMLLNEYVTMFVSEETRGASSDAEEEQTSERLSPASRNWAESLTASQYPSIAALADYFAGNDTDERFQFGIQILQAGLTSHHGIAASF